MQILVACGFAGVLAAALPTAVLGQVQATAAAADLTALSLDELVNVKVSTASRKPEPWWMAATGVDVVTGDDIRRYGAESLPDALRLGTGVHVGQSSARSWAISLRGMNVLAANKISVVMDGRSLFTPLFSGVQWDAQDTLIEDIERIEVVRGPVGALWGAFAVNGFVQILTKPAGETQGWLLSAATGTEDPGRFGARYGARLGEHTFGRAYAKYFQQDWTYNAEGAHAQPSTDFFQGGFRLDRQPSDATGFGVQGDYYTNQGLPLDRPLTEVSVYNMLGRWRRAYSADSELQADGYVDHTYRLIPGQFEERRTTGSASVRYRRAAGRHTLLLGADAMVSPDDIGNIGFAQLVPAERTSYTVGAYVQDTLHVGRNAAVVAGLKGEQSYFAGFELQPTLRFVLTPSPHTTLWTAFSRAVRTPVRVDEDLVIAVSGATFFAANDDFATETAFAYEVGVRRRVASTLTLMASGFAYEYDHLRSTEPAGAAPVPQTFKNGLDARSYGGEVALMYQPLPRLFFRGSYRFLDLSFSKDPDSRDTSNGSAEGNDPRHLAVAGAVVALPAEVEVGAFLRVVGALPNPELDGFATMDARLSWRPADDWEIALSGRNLLDRQHAEFVTTNSLNEEVHRSALLKLTWRH
jgi:iron complex outermembrane receptor protein